MVELDHVFIVVPARSGPEVAALRAAGFFIDTASTRHAGPGTASVAVFFENAYLEPGGIGRSRSDSVLLEVELDRRANGERIDLRPLLPLVIQR